jgi:uncharacterized membrane protein
MNNPLKTRIGTFILGIVLSVVAIVILASFNPAGFRINTISFWIWMHVVVGIAWIGLLYYFNFVQVPAVNQALADGEPGPAAINKYVAPRALFWFRYAALLTWLSGAAALEAKGYGFLRTFAFMNESFYGLSLGAWLGTIMLFNVWVFIWPNQKKILGLVQSTPEVIAKAKVTALMASRTNTVLSLPMLLGMISAGHGLPFNF